MKLLSGGIAAIRDWASGGGRAIPRHPKDGRSSLTYGGVRRAAVALHGPGTKVRMWHDGSGHILPPPPYREEENLYGFEHEFQLRRQLPSLGTMTMEEWYAAKGEEPWWLPPEERAMPPAGGPAARKVLCRPPGSDSFRPAPAPTTGEVRTAAGATSAASGLDDLRRRFDEVESHGLRIEEVLMDAEGYRDIVRRRPGILECPPGSPGCPNAAKLLWGAELTVSECVSPGDFHIRTVAEGWATSPAGKPPS